MSAGIDYGMGKTNIDANTGIRYGVISMHDVLQAWSDDSVPDYGEPTCPKCGNTLEKYDEDKHGEYECYHKGSCADFACEPCEHYLDSEYAYGDEPHGYVLDNDGYKAHSCLDNDIMILESPYYTKAQFCSPCVPGAGNLNCADEDGVKTYCFGHDWFEDGKAPYPVYSVETGEVVEPAKES